MSVLIRELRENLNISQVQLARILGLTKNNLNSIEQGNRALPQKLKSTYVQLQLLSEQESFKRLLDDRNFEEGINALLFRQLQVQLDRLNFQLKTKQKRLTAFHEKYETMHVQMRSLSALEQLLPKDSDPLLNVRIQKEMYQVQFDLEHKVLNLLVKQLFDVTEIQAKIESIEILLKKGVISP